MNNHYNNDDNNDNKISYIYIYSLYINYIF